MSLIDPKTGKVWIEVTSSDEFFACHHAIIELTDEDKKIVLDLHTIAEANKGKIDYVSTYPSIDVEFFEDEDSEESLRIEGLTLHVDRNHFWLSAWLKNSSVRVETLFIDVSELRNNYHNGTIPS